ncbi:unnamed protein product [Mytilus edulis]|uniref:Uncharacterized protein n=1 Tax=Mytilus edulis TaxID=6550 RepID=A0A8S3SCN2_MYTED|nr:unnamed protein product [Mytilus edulis]
MLVGEHGTGKTTIARYLVGKSPTKPKVKSTDGIELTNGLSYIDRETSTWLVGEQEVATSRSLFNKVRIQKSVHDTPTTKHPKIPLNVRETMANPQLKTGSNNGDNPSTSQAPIETVRTTNDPKDLDNACSESGSNGNMHTQTVTQPGPLRRLKTFWSYQKVEEVKVTITKDKFFQMVSKVGKKMLHKKR